MLGDNSSAVGTGRSVTWLICCNKKDATAFAAIEFNPRPTAEVIRAFGIKPRDQVVTDKG